MVSSSSPFLFYFVLLLLMLSSSEGKFISDQRACRETKNDMKEFLLFRHSGRLKEKHSFFLVIFWCYCICVCVLNID